MARHGSPSPGVLAGFLTVACLVVAPSPSSAHPLGNFSISQYTAIRITPDVIELRYVVDLAEIPTFQEIQETGIVPEVRHPSLSRYLPRRVDTLKEGLVLEVDGHRLVLQADFSDVAFPRGAGGLPTVKLGVVYRARVPSPGTAGPNRLRYRDGNFSGRAGWKEIIAVAGRGVTLIRTSVPDKDRSQELTDYPVDLLNTPPQDLEAKIVFTRAGPPPAVVTARSGSAASGEGPSRGYPAPQAGAPAMAPSSSGEGPMTGRDRAGTEAPLRLQANKQGTPQSAFTDLIASKELSAGIILVALVVAAALGAFHAVEPGHGKTIVGAYLIGSRGTAWHAVWLGLIVTASHTGGVYLLGGVTLYASRYVIPERIYPWLGLVSGLTIAGLGVILFLRRCAGGIPWGRHDHAYDSGHPHRHGALSHAHGPGDPSSHDHDHSHLDHQPDGAVSLSALVALGVTGGIVPCPAALVVLLSALSLNRVGFGLLLIVAFSVGLAAVLIAIGMLMVYARRFMARFQTEGSLITRWLPLTSSAVITLLGLGITVQALVAAGLLEIHL